MQKITETSFSQFGSMYFQPIASERYDLNCNHIHVSSGDTYELFCFSDEVYIEPTQGIGSILIGKTPDLENLTVFPLHHCLIIKPNLYFSVIARSKTMDFCVLTKQGTNAEKIPLNNPYISKTISVPFNISQVLDCSYITHEAPCTFSKPPHEYYDLLYVCEGSVRLSEPDGKRYTLNSHDIILLNKSSKTSRHFSLNTSCSYLIAVLDLQTAGKDKISGQVFHCPVELQSILWRIIQESSSDSPYTQMLMLCHIQQAIAELLQLKYELNQNLIDTTHSFQNNQLKKILSYMDARVTERLSIEDICHEFFMSRSSLQTLFKVNLGCSPKSYLINIKLQKSKELLRKNQHTISEVAYLLGFSSIHYFSRLFKKYFHISPSEYAHGTETQDEI